MNKTATEVIAEVFTAGELDDDCQIFASGLRAAWESGQWSDQKIEETLRVAEQGK